MSSDTPGANCLSANAYSWEGLANFLQQKMPVEEFEWHRAPAHWPMRISLTVGQCVLGHGGNLLTCCSSRDICVLSSSPTCIGVMTIKPSL